MRTARWLFPLACAALIACLARPVPAGKGGGPTPRVVGIVADNAEESVTAFDVRTGAVLGSVALPSDADSVGDCLLSADGRFGFVTDFAFRVWVIDLTGPAPALAAGTNPIVISNFGEDLSLTPDGRFLVVADGLATQPVSVVDLETRTEVDTLAVGSNPISVEVCGDGSVLVASFNDGTVRRLTIDASGQLTDTGEVLTLGEPPMNLLCAPGSQIGLVITSEGTVATFTIPGLTQVASRELSGSVGISGVVHPAGDRVWIRSSSIGERGGLEGIVVPEGAIDLFALDPATGALSEGPLLTIPIARALTFFGMDQMALRGDHLFVPQPGAVHVHDAFTGAFLGAITAESIDLPTGIAVPGTVSLCEPPPPSTRGVRVFAGTTLLQDDGATATLRASGDVRRSGRVVGNVSYRNPSLGVTLESTRLVSVVRSGTTVRLFGRGLVRDRSQRPRPADFVVEVDDQAPFFQGGDLATIEICGVLPPMSGVFPRGHGVLIVTRRR